MNSYKHTQQGKLLWIVMGILSMVDLAIGLTVTKPVLIAAPFLLLAAWLFHSLTIEINERELRWYFGPGIISKRVSLNEIAGAEAVKTSIVEGWGIHWSSYGWLYNISGFNAVAITLRSGKRFALGTDEPEVLLEKLQGTVKNSNPT